MRLFGLECIFRLCPDVSNVSVLAILLMIVKGKNDVFGVVHNMHTNNVLIRIGLNVSGVVKIT